MDSRSQLTLAQTQLLTVFHSAYLERAAFPALFAMQKKVPAAHNSKVSAVARSEVCLAVSAKKSVEVALVLCWGSQRPTSVRSSVMLLVERGLFCFVSFFFHSVDRA